MDLATASASSDERATSPLGMPTPYYCRQYTPYLATCVHTDLSSLADRYS